MKFASCRIALASVAASALAVASSGTALGQVVGSFSGAGVHSPVDASALGVTRPASVGLTSGDASPYSAFATFGVAHGALGVYAGAVGNHVGRWVAGAGYAQTFLSREPISRLHATLGGQLVAGFRHERYGVRDAGSLDLTIPVGLALGHPDAYSFAVYAAPYAAVGVGREWYASDCRDYCYALGGNKGMGAAGVGMGARISLNRFALSGFMPSRRFLSLSVSVRLGH
jgi:hypothetical protein